MKTFIFTLLLLASYFSQAQTDLIITTTGDSIQCTITLVNDNNVFYTYKKKKREESTYVSLSLVAEYVYNGKQTKPVLPVEPQTDAMPSAAPVPTKPLHGMGTIITGFLLQAVGSVFTIVAAAGILDIQDGRPIVYAASGLNVVGIGLVISGLQQN